MNLFYKRMFPLTLTLITVYLVMLFFLFFEQILGIIEYVTNEEFQQATVDVYSGPIAYFVTLLREKNYGFDLSIITGTSIFQIGIPFLGTVAAASFITRFRTVGQLAYPRLVFLKKNLWIDTVGTASLFSLACFCGFFLFWLTSLLLSRGAIQSDITRPLFLDFFGSDFYQAHRYLYTLLEGGLRFLWIPFAYSIFGIACSLLSENRALTAAPILYYFGMVIIGSAVENQSNLANYISPLVIMASGDVEQLNTFLIITTNSLPLLLGLLLIWKRGGTVED